MNKREEELLEHLGQSARDAYEGKLPQWEYQPECVTDSWWFTYCDDCNTFHREAYEHGYVVTKGQIEEVIWNCDEDGNWDISDSFYLHDPDYDERAKWYSPEEWEKQYRAYCEHVAETGEDPCHEFNVKQTDKMSEWWAIRVCDSPEGVIFLAASRGNGDWLVEGLPDRLTNYLCLERKPLFSLVAPEVFGSVGDMQRQSTGGGWRKVEVTRDGCLVWVDEFDIEIEHEAARPEGQVREELQAAARKYLDRSPKS